jgi:hypothetical protein
MLKARLYRLFLAVLAALGMSSALAQTGPAVGGYNTTTSGNTTSHTYAASGASDMSRLMRGGYDPATNQSGFQTLLQKKGFTPKGSDYDTRITKAVPKAAMAKAISKFALRLSPIGYAAGVFESAADLMAELFPDKNPRWDTADGRWEMRGPDTYQWCAGSRCGPSMAAACEAERNPGTYFEITNQTATNATCRYFASAHGGFIGNVNISRSLLAPGQDQPITEQDVDSALSTGSTIPPEVDPLIAHIPQPELDQLARDIEADTSNKPRAVPMSPSGVESPSGLTIPESTTSSSGTDSQGRPYTRTTETQTIARTLPSGQIQHDTKTTTTTTTRTGTNPDGSPITETTTGEETTSTTPAPTPDGTNPTAPSENIITCGLPDTPPCKIDETGTPQADPAKTQEEIDSIFGQIKTCLQDIKACLPALPNLSWSFALPSGCSPLTFDTLVGTVIEIDMCQHQPTIHDLMSMLWAAAGLFGAVSLVARFSAGGA